MAVPKRKTSKMKSRSRRGGHAVRAVAAANPCPECGAPTLPHRVCNACGSYRGRQVVTVSADE